MHTVDLAAGTVHYETHGPDDGRPVVFVHGYAMGASLWRPLAEHLGQQGFRCFAPTWPLGAHPVALRPGADRTMTGAAATVADFLDRLDLTDVLLVGNDTGGLVSQLVAGTYPDRIGRLVLTACDAFEHFPPPVLKPMILASRSRATFRLALQGLRLAAVRKQFFGPLAHTDIDHLVREWAAPALRDAAVAEDLRAFTASLHQQTALDAAARLGGFTKPALIAWSADDAFFPAEDGRRLADTLPDARLHVIERARTFAMLDRTAELAGLITEFATAPQH
jgi:pimeloyl-ACP methyl ester carboxylesterase